MSEWCKLAEVADTNPETLSSSTDADYMFRYIDLSAVEAGRIDWNRVRAVRFAEAPSRARRKVVPGDVLFGTVRPNLQSHGFIDDRQRGDLVASTGFSVVRAKEGRAAGRYLFHAMLSQRVYAQSINAAVGSNYPAVNDSDVRDFEVFCPPVREQEFVARILDTLDTQIRRTEALIGKLEQIKQGLLTDLLTRGIDDNGQLRPPPEQAPHLYKDSPLGRIPREWAVLAADEFCTSVADGTHDSPKPAKAGYPLVTSKHLKPDGLDLSDAYLISKRDFDAIVARSWVEPGDILYGMIGTVGNPAVIRPGQEQIAPKNVGIFRSGGDLQKGRYLLAVLRSPLVGRQIDLVMAGSTQKFVGLGALRRILLPLPTRNELETVAERVSAYEDLQRQEEARLQKLRAQKQGLMDDLLTGRVRVTPLLDKTAAVAG